jgi:cation diffusion facilitator family transporter
MGDQPNWYRIAALKDFLPLNTDQPPLSARNQSRSTSNLAAMKNRSFASHRRRSSFGADDLPGRTSNETARDEDLLPEGQAALLSSSHWGGGEPLRRMSTLGSLPASLMTPQMRSQRLIGNSNPRYKWEQYWKSEKQLREMKKPIRKYYERNNYLIQNYMYIDRLLDSSLPHNLIQEYNRMDGHGPSGPAVNELDVPETITEEVSPHATGSTTPSEQNGSTQKVKRTPRDIYRVQQDETTPLLPDKDVDDEEQIMPPDMEYEEETGSQSRVVTVAIYLNLVANTVLLIMKIVVVALSSSVSVLASLVDAALDFLSTAIVWVTTRLISRNDQYQYPIGRRRLEPIGVLVFSVIMITSFVQVGLEGFYKLTGPDHEIVKLSPAAIAIMAATVVIKFLCWLWCRLIKNSSVQALAQDAMTDVVFNIFSIIFPLIGYYASVWWLDPLGGILLSLYVILNWAATSATHIRNLTGAAATADERNILLYLTMRFAKTVRKIQGLQAYHSGDKLNVEVDVVLDEHTSLRDSHDLGESLQYVLESVPNGQSELPLPYRMAANNDTVDRAFVHMDYSDYNLPSHLQQDS